MPSHGGGSDESEISILLTSKTSVLEKVRMYSSLALEVRIIRYARGGLIRRVDASLIVVRVLCRIIELPFREHAHASMEQPAEWYVDVSSIVDVRHRDLFDRAV